MTRRDAATETLFAIAWVVAVVLVIAAGAGTLPLSPFSAVTVVLMLVIGAVDSHRIRRAERFMRSHRIEVISHVHDGGEVHALTRHAPTERQIQAWQAFADAMSETTEEPPHE